MKRALVVSLLVYIALGAVFAASTMPDQMWVCPDPQSPSGEVAYGGLSEPPQDNCRPTVTAGEQLRWVAFATPVWLPLVVAKGLSNAAES
jgi:hypothetical protein